MSWLLEDVPSLFEDGADDAADDAADGAGNANDADDATDPNADQDVDPEADSATSASQVVDDCIIDGVGNNVEDGTQIESDVKEGIEESQNEMKDVLEKIEKNEPGAAEAAKDLEKSWAKTLKNIWAGGKPFGKFIGTELAKGAIFTAGTFAAQKTLTKLFPPQQPTPQKPAPGASTTTTPATAPKDDPRVVIVKSVNKAGKILQDALDTWSNWEASHYKDRDTFGQVAVDNMPGMNLSVFFILQNAISSLGTQRDKLIPLLNTMKQSKTLDATTALLTANIAYAKSVVEQATNINTNMSAMVTAGLDSKLTEVQAAYSMLVAASA